MLFQSQFANLKHKMASLCTNNNEMRQDLICMVGGMNSIDKGITYILGYISRQ